MKIENPYILLTPGPLTTSASVKEAMMRDWCTWDDDYNLISKLRIDLTALAVKPENRDKHTVVLMQGSGTFCVGSVIGSVIQRGGKLLVPTNGAYGKRIVKMAETLGIAVTEIAGAESEQINIEALGSVLDEDPAIKHVAVVHCETTTGILNDIRGPAAEAKRRGKTLIVDAMSSFGGIPFYMDEIEADFTISSANKCVQGVPGFGIIIARSDALKECRGRARSLSLDLYDQWETMEKTTASGASPHPLTLSGRLFRQWRN